MPSGRSWFEVAALDPSDSWGCGRRCVSTAAHSTRPGPDRGSTATRRGFALSELPGHRTRLLVSGYAASSPRALTAIGDLLFWEPAHWIMQLRQLVNLKARAEDTHPIAGDVPEPAGAMSGAGVG